MTNLLHDFEALECFCALCSPAVALLRATIWSHAVVVWMDLNTRQETANSVIFCWRTQIFSRKTNQSLCVRHVFCVVDSICLRRVLANCCCCMDPNDLRNNRQFAPVMDHFFTLELLACKFTCSCTFISSSIDANFTVGRLLHEGLLKSSTDNAMAFDFW